MKEQTIPIKTDEKKAPEDKVQYSALEDSVVAKYSGNTAALISIFDNVINTLSSRLQSVNSFAATQMPFWLKGLYYLLPMAIPLVPYARHRWNNQAEIYDPDAIELLGLLQEKDKEFKAYIAGNPEEKEQVLEILTSYLKYEKNHSRSIFCLI